MVGGPKLDLMYKYNKSRYMVLSTHGRAGQGVTQDGGHVDNGVRWGGGGAGWIFCQNSEAKSRS